jgi:DNA mismatch repair ATPase MutS
MKAFLMHKEKDFELHENLSSSEQDLLQDFELETLLTGIACGDEFLFVIAKWAFMTAIHNDLETILYRQAILKDCLKNASIVKEIYDIALDAIAKEKKNYWGILSDYPFAILHRSIDVLQMFVTMLRKLRNVADQYAESFESEGFSRFFSMLQTELGDDYFAVIQTHLKEMKFRGGVLLSAELGKSNKGTNYVLRKLRNKKPHWLKWILAEGPPGYTFYIHPRDESGGRALSELNDRGISLVANALAQSTEHICSVFNMLRRELAFYIGCLNLHGKLTEMGEPMCFPVPVAGDERRHSFKELYDVCLALSMKRRVVGSDVNADNKELVIITGANQGGKSTFLRSIGLAQIMMQSGIFVPAESFSANICDGLFTHYKREEDATMKSGKFDEELSRMSDIVDNIVPRSMLLFNESFAATNDREGSEIAKQIVSALLEKHIKMFFVTHLYEFAHGMFQMDLQNTMFLWAEREADGGRTFKSVEGEPLQTSYGQDLCDTIFADREQVPSPCAV